MKRNDCNLLFSSARLYVMRHYNRDKVVRSRGFDVQQFRTDQCGYPRHPPTAIYLRDATTTTTIAIAAAVYGGGVVSFFPLIVCRIVSSSFGDISICFLSSHPRIVRSFVQLLQSLDAACKTSSDWAPNVSLISQQIVSFQQITTLREKTNNVRVGQ